MFILNVFPARKKKHDAGVDPSTYIFFPIARAAWVDPLSLPLVYIISGQSLHPLVPSVFYKGLVVACLVENEASFILHVWDYFFFHPFFKNIRVHF